MKTRTKPDGGFRFIGAYELLWVYFAFSAKLIRWYDVRVWFACQEAVARRCGAKSGIPARYREEEIGTLVSRARVEQVRAALKRLQRAGLLGWSGEGIAFAKSPDEIRIADRSGFWRMVEDLGQRNRKVPVPRRTIRLIAGGARKVLTATILGQLLRCCYYRRGEYSSEGSCSASWIASLFGLDERNVKIARNHLASIGWLTRMNADAWHRQRFGGRAAVNPVWGRSMEPTKRPTVVATRKAREPEPKRSPQNCDSGTKRSPLLILKGNSFGSKNQKPALAADRPSGVCKPESVSSKPPTLKHVVVEDLRDTARTLRLFEHAADAGFVRRCEADRLKVVAAAERALRVGNSNPCGFFATLVRRKLWHHATQNEEERARRRLRRHLFESEGQTGFGWSLSARPAYQLSMDARVVAATKRLVDQHRLDMKPLQALRCAQPDWTEERWLRAEAELANSCIIGFREMSLAPREGQPGARP